MTVSTRPLPGSGTASNLATSATFGPWPLTSARLSIAVAWSGTPTGSFALQMQMPDGTWAAIPGASAEFTSNSQAQPAGAASSAAWTWYGIPAANVRLSYTATSGTGTLTGQIIQGD